MTAIYLEQDGDRYTVSAQGHATGSMEVCAAVSTLLYTLDAFLHNATADVMLERLEPGDALIVFAGGAEAATAFDFVTVGFMQLAISDPATIKVETKIIS